MLSLSDFFSIHTQISSIMLWNQVRKGLLQADTFNKSWNRSFHLLLSISMVRVEKNFIYYFTQIKQMIYCYDKNVFVICGILHVIPKQWCIDWFIDLVQEAASDIMMPIQLPFIIKFSTHWTVPSITFTLHWIGSSVHSFIHSYRYNRLMSCLHLPKESNK